MKITTRYVLTGIAGILGTVALTLYFSAPFHWMPLPPPAATIAQVVEFGRTYHEAILVDTWLQQIGTIFSVVFALSLVQFAGTSQSLPGRLTLLSSTVITSLSLAEGTFALGAVQSGENGHYESALTCFELTNVFIHIFLMAPSLFLMLGFAIRRSAVLPAFFPGSAIALGILFQTLGALALFFPKLLLLVIMVLGLQNLWTLFAAIFLLLRIPSVKRSASNNINRGSME